MGPSFDGDRYPTPAPFKDMSQGRDGRLARCREVKRIRGSTSFFLAALSGSPRAESNDFLVFYVTEFLGGRDCVLCEWTLRVPSMLICDKLMLKSASNALTG